MKRVESPSHEAGCPIGNQDVRQEADVQVEVDVVVILEGLAPKGLSDRLGVVVVLGLDALVGQMAEERLDGW